MTENKRHPSQREARVYRLPERPLPPFDDPSTEVGSENCRNVVVDFPTKTAAAVDEGSKAFQEQPCPTREDRATGSSIRPSSTGSTPPRPAGRGTGSLGVLMPSMTISQPFTGLGNADVGSLTHALIATHAPLRDAAGYPADLVARMFAVTDALLDANPNRRRAVGAEAVSLANRYLTRLAPTAPWTLFGVEYDTGDGYVDVAWVNTLDQRVFFDEVKTSRSATRTMPTTWVPQARRYAVAGQARFGGSFSGTRLLPVNVMRFARLVGPLGLPSALRPTAADPLRTV